jgi:CheY-like chemotaxis protein
MAWIYIIEDDQDLGVDIQTVLETAGHRVSLFRLVSDAVEAFKVQPPDAVVTDIIIRDEGRVQPDGGLTAIWQIKQAAQALKRPVYIVAISGAVTQIGMGNVLTSADQFGANAALQKPFDPEDLLYVLEKGLASGPQEGDAPGRRGLLGRNHGLRAAL